MAVYTLAEYMGLKKKKEQTNVISLSENAKKNGKGNALAMSSIAPTKKTSEDIAPVNDTWYEGWLQKSQGNVAQTILGSATDLAENATTGILGMGEKIADTLAYIGPGVTMAQDAQNSIAYEFDIDKYNEMQDASTEFIKKDLYNEESIAKNIITGNAKKVGIDTEKHSVFGEKTDALAQSAGQLGATIGLQAVGVPWFVTTGTTSFGSETENALKQDATYGKAGGSALVSAGAEILTEKLSGGIKFGGKTLDDGLTKLLARKISDKYVRTATKLGVDAVGEGLEEVISSGISNLGSALYKEKNLGELLFSEEAVDEYIESFIGGAVLGGVGSSINAVKAKKQGVDSVTERTDNEQKVFDAEYKKRIEEAQKDNNKLTDREKKKIYEQLENDLEKGYINIDTIESTLGGNTYNKYKEAEKQEEELSKKLEELKNAPNTVGNAKLYEETENKLAELKKNSNKTQIKEQLSEEVKKLTLSDRLSESYNEKARRSQAYEADLTKYDEKQQAVIKKAVESGILNNTNKTHEFVDMIAKISADKGVSFDFANNTKLKESGFAVEGRIVNGVLKDGNITLNVDSNKALNTVVGHEISHVLEGTELFAELKNVIKEYATTKGEYQKRYDELAELYKNIKDAVIENEVTSELIGDYLFTDSDFINKLSTEKPNVFKKMYEEVKYIFKLATAGSKEARELEKVKKSFDKAYKETASTGKTTDYHVSSTFAEEIDKTLNNTMAKDSQVKARDFTPEYLVNNGAKDLPMLITQNHVKTVVYTEAEAKKLGLPVAKGINYHGLGKDLLVKAIDNMDTPSAVYKKDANNFIIITELTDNSGNTIIVPVRINGKGAYNNVYIDENHITSVYGKKNLQNYLDNNNFTEIDIKKGTTLNGGVQYSNISSSFKSSISQNKKNTTGNYNVYGKDIALETSENGENTAEISKNSEKISETAPKNTVFDDYAPLTEEEANERDAMHGDRMYDLNDFDMPEEVEAPYYEETVETTEVESPFEEKDIQEVGNRKQKAYMYENPEVKPYFQAEANVMLGELRNSVKGEKHFDDQLYYDTNGEQGWYGTKRETSEQIAYMLDRFKYTYADIEKGLRAIIEDHGAENNAVSKRLEFMLDERLREGYTDFASGYEIPSNQEYINLLNEKQITEYSDEAYNRYLESLAYAEAPEVEAPVDEVQVLYSLEAQQQEKIAELDGVVEAEDIAENTELPTMESFDAKLENYKNALEGYKTAKNTIENAFEEAINKKTAEYEALKQKDTKRASDLLTQIENLKLRKSNNVLKIDSKIAKVEKNIDKMSKGIPTRRQIYHRNIVDNIKNVFASKGYDFDTVLKNAKDKGTFSSVDNTPQRFIEKSLGYKAGQILNDLTINKVAQNESEGIKWVNSYTDKKNGLLAQISKEYGIKPRSKESASAQMYAEGFWVDDDGNLIKYGDEELAKDYSNEEVRENIKKLAKDERIRKIYDETLDKINESRTRNLYEAIPKRKNYFLHFMEMDDTFSRLGIPFNPNDIRAKDLPTDINGMTADLKPGQPYFASANRRMGNKTTYDLLGGVERYLNSAKNQIYHIDDIQTLRALRNYLAETYGRAEGLENLDSMTEEEAMARIQEVFNSHLSTFAMFLNEEANVLAGKTSLVDRGIEGIIGRRGIQFLNTVNRQVGSNMVGANVSSALTNTVSMVQAVAKTNKADAVKAFAQTTYNLLGSVVGKTDGFAEKNPMIIRRKGIERMTRTPWEKITDVGYLLAGAVDNISSEFIVRTKFNELTRKGMNEQQAHIEADKWASRLLGDRSLGQQPLLYNSKMLGLFTKFQLEVRNQLDSQFYDTIQEAKISTEEIENQLVRNAKKSAKITSTLVQLAAFQHLFGMAFESIAGYNPTFDIVETFIKIIGLDDDEESEDTVLDNVEEGFLNLLEDLPYTSTFTGGRIPIASALPIEQFITGKDDYGNEKSRWETFAETAPYYIMPTGYGQLKKTIAGMNMFSDELPVSGSYTKSGNLRFPVEDTPLNRLQAGVFGQYASKNARDYFDNERNPLKEKQIQEYKDLDIPISDYWKYREGLSEHGKLSEKADYINSLDLPISKKNIMINNVSDRKDPIDFTDYDKYSDFEEFDYATKNPDKYAVSKVVGGYKSYTAYMKKIDNMSGEDKKEKVKEYIFNLNIDEGQKYILYRSLYAGAKDRKSYDTDIFEYLNSRDDISYEDKITIFESLGFKVYPDGTVEW